MSASSRPPVRLQLRRARQGARAERESYEDLQRLLSRDYQRDASFLEKVVNHHDETLPWMLIQQEPELANPDRLEESEWREQLPALRAALCARAHRELLEEEIAWSPLMDALFVSEAWEREESDPPLKGLPWHGTLLKPLVEWNRDAPPARELESLLVFRARPIAELLAQSPTPLPPELAIRVSERPGTPYYLGNNENLSPATLRALALHAWSKCQEQTEQVLQAPLEYGKDERITWGRLLATMTARQRNTPPEMREWLMSEIQEPVQEGWRALRTAELRDLYIASLAAVPTLSAEEVTLLVELHSRTNELPLTLLTHSRLTLAQRISLLERHQSPSVDNWRELLKEPTLPLTLLERAAEEHPYAYDLSLMLALHPSANTELRLRLASGPRAARVQLALADEKELRTEPRLRAHLANSEDASILRSLLEDADSEEWAALFRRAAKLDAAMASRLLEEAPSHLLAALTRQDLAPLLGSEVAAVRLAAIRSLAQMEQGEAAGAPTVSREGALSPSTTLSR